MAAQPVIHHLHFLTTQLRKSSNQKSHKCIVINYCIWRLVRKGVVCTFLQSNMISKSSAEELGPGVQSHCTRGHSKISDERKFNVIRIFRHDPNIHMYCLYGFKIDFRNLLDQGTQLPVSPGLLFPLVYTFHHIVLCVCDLCTRLHPRTSPFQTNNFQGKMCFYAHLSMPARQQQDT